MKFLPFLLIIALFSCGKQKSPKPKIEDTGDQIKKEAFQSAINYSKSILSNPTSSLPDLKGVFSVSDSTKRIELNPGSVHVGHIDDDQSTDAIVSMIFYHSNQTVSDHHLILLNNNGKLEQKSVIEMNMRIIVINNGKITAEFHTKPRTSIYYQCTKCKKIVDYQFKNDSLIALN